MSDIFPKAVLKQYSENCEHRCWRFGDPISGKFVGDDNKTTLEFFKEYMFIPKPDSGDEEVRKHAMSQRVYGKVSLVLTRKGGTDYTDMDSLTGELLWIGETGAEDIPSLECILDKPLDLSSMSTIIGTSSDEEDPGYSPELSIAKKIVKMGVALDTVFSSYFKERS